jgi:hypothetical protein
MIHMTNNNSKTVLESVKCFIMKNLFNNIPINYIKYHTVIENEKARQAEIDKANSKRWYQK